MVTSLVSSVNLIKRPLSFPAAKLVEMLIVLTAETAIQTAVIKVEITVANLAAVTYVALQAAAQAAVHLVLQQVPVTKLVAVQKLPATMALVVIGVNRIVAMTILAPALLYILVVVNNVTS